MHSNGVIGQSLPFRPKIGYPHGIGGSAPFDGLDEPIVNTGLNLHKLVLDPPSILETLVNTRF